MLRQGRAIVPGCIAALSSRWGRLSYDASLPAALHSPHHGHWIHALAPDRVVFARVHCIHRGPEAARLLAAIEPPGGACSTAEVRDYADAIAGELERLGWDAQASLAYVQRRSGGIVGWVCGGASIWSLSPPGPCSPSQTLVMPPRSVHEKPLTVSSIAPGKVVGGQPFEANGRAFAGTLSAPPVELEADEIGALARHHPVHGLYRLGIRAAQQAHSASALLWLWSDEAEPSADWIRSDQELPRHGMARDWLDLRDPSRGVAGDYIEGALELVDDVDADPDGLLQYFSVQHRWLSGVAALAGPAAARELAASQARVFERVIDALAGRSSLFAREAAAALAYQETLRAIGAQADAQLPAAEWLERLAGEDFRDVELQSFVGLLAAGLGRSDLVERALGGAAVSSARAGARFGFNVQGLAHHLAAAVRDGAGADCVAAAWDDFLASFPHKLGAKSLDWRSLTTVATTVFHQLGGRPRGETAATLAAAIDDSVSELMRPVEIEATAGVQTNSGGFARLRVRFERRRVATAPLDIVTHLSVDELPEPLLVAAKKGLFAAASDEPTLLSGYRAEIVRAWVHPTDATTARFEQCGREAVARFLDRPGTMGPQR